MSAVSTALSPVPPLAVRYIPQVVVQRPARHVRDGRDVAAAVAAEGDVVVEVPPVVSSTKRLAAARSGQRPPRRERRRRRRRESRAPRLPASSYSG